MGMCRQTATSYMKNQMKSGSLFRQLKKHGPHLRNRLVGEATRFKPLLNMEMLKDPERGVSYFLWFLSPHFIKDNEHVFLWRFFRLLNKKSENRHHDVDSIFCHGAKTIQGLKDGPSSFGHRQPGSKPSSNHGTRESENAYKFSTGIQHAPSRVPEQSNESHFLPGQ